MNLSRQRGAAEFSKLLVNAVHYISFEIACIQRKYNLKNPEHRVRFATEAAEILAKLDSEIERNVYLGEVSRVTGVEEEATAVNSEAGAKRGCGLPKGGRKAAAESEELHAGGQKKG